MARFAADPQHDAARSDVARPARADEAGVPRQRFQPRRHGSLQPDPADDDERADFLDQWFETDVLKATMSASGSSGRFSACGRRGRPTCCSTTTWARSTRSPAWACARRHQRDLERDAAAAQEAASRSAPGGGREITVSEGKASGVVLANGDGLGRPGLSSRSNLTFLKFLDAKEPAAEFLDEVRATIHADRREGELGLDALPNFTVHAGREAAPAGRSRSSPGLDYMERAYDQAKYGEFSRRRHGCGDSDAHRSVGRAAGQAHPVLLHAYASAKPGVDGTTSASRSATPSSTPSPMRRTSGHHPAPAGADAARPRTRFRADRGISSRH